MDANEALHHPQECRNGAYTHSPTAIIPKIPHLIRETDPTAYMPILVAIGPHHRNNSHLNAMDQLKDVYHQRFLLRNSTLSKDNYIQHLKPLIPRIRSCYSDDYDMEEDEWLDMLLVDGCFIIELLLTVHNYDDHCSRNEQDPILDNMLYLSLVKNDMLLLENQLPFFVLDALFDLGIESNGREEYSHSLVKLAIDFFASHLPPKYSKQSTMKTTDYFYHILHLFHSCATAVNLANAQADEGANFQGQSQMIPPATQLQDFFRVKFMSKDDGSICDASFKRDGWVMEVSPVLLNNNTNSLYRNLIAFEQYCFCFPKVRKTPVIAYVMLMGCLIDSKKDLDLVRQEGVLDYTFNHQKASDFFKQLCADTIDDYYKFYHANLEQLSTELWNLYDSAHKWYYFDAYAREHKVTLMIVSLMLLQLMLEYFTAQRDCTKRHRFVFFCLLALQLMEVYFSAQPDGMRTRKQKGLFFITMIAQLMQEYLTAQQDCGSRHRSVFFSLLLYEMMMAYFATQHDHTKRNKAVFYGLVAAQLMFTCFTILSYYQP